MLVCVTHVWLLGVGRVTHVWLLGVGLCHTHLAAPQLEVGNYNELNTDCRYAGTKKERKKEKCFINIIFGCYLSQIS